MHGLAGLLSERDHLAEKVLFISTEQSSFRDTFVSRVGGTHGKAGPLRGAPCLSTRVCGAPGNSNLRLQAQPMGRSVPSQPTLQGTLRPGLDLTFERCRNAGGPFDASHQSPADG